MKISAKNQRSLGSSFEKTFRFILDYFPIIYSPVFNTVSYWITILRLLDLHAALICSIWEHESLLKLHFNEGDFRYDEWRSELGASKGAEYACGQK